MIFEAKLDASCIELYQPLNYVYVDEIHRFKRAKNTLINISSDTLWELAT